jgi:hypothetical protein
MASSDSQFDKKKYVFCPKMMDGSLLDVTYQYALMRARNEDMQDGDQQVAKTPVAHGDRLMETLLEYLRPKVEEATGRQLLPTYSCFRVYKNGDDLARHTDREACEVSVTVTLGFDAPKSWPIYVGSKLFSAAVDMQPGDAVIYKGCELAHWRKEFHGVHHAQVFLHYVDANGPNTDWIYNKRPGGLGTFKFAGGQTVGDT